MAFSPCESAFQPGEYLWWDCRGIIGDPNDVIWLHCHLDCAVGCPMTGCVVNEVAHGHREGIHIHPAEKFGSTRLHVANALWVFQSHGAIPDHQIQNGYEID